MHVSKLLDTIPESKQKMAFATVIAFLLLQTLSPATSHLLSPLLDPLYDNLCEKVECGKGKCKPSQNKTVLFECDCDPGWRQTFSAHDDGFKFLPCIVPNCTMNRACSNAPAPAPQDRKRNQSIFDACHWVDCGGGSCKKTSLFTYSCNCDDGYYNLLNSTALPCFRECAIGFGCSDLGISLTNSSTASPRPPSDDNGIFGFSASLILRGSSPWLLMLIIFITIVELQ